MSMSLDEVTCYICYQILVEPIKFFCNHELCIICASSLIENKKYSCPMCREKIPQVLCYGSLPILINKDRWAQIKEKFPKEVFERLPDLIEFHKRQAKIVRI